MGQLEHKVAITGGGSGIGRPSPKRFSARLRIDHRRAQRQAAAAAEELRAGGGEVGRAHRRRAGGAGRALSAGDGAARAPEYLVTAPGAFDGGHWRN